MSDELKDSETVLILYLIIMKIQFYIIKEDEFGEDFKQIVTPEPSELKVGLSSQKHLPKGVVSMVKPLRTSTLYYETLQAESTQK